MTREWTTAWKLTDGLYRTYGGTQWGEGIENPHGVKRGDGGLCSSAWYHGYESPYLALLMNPIHANIARPVLWQAEWRGKREDDRGLKFGATEFRTVRIVEAPVITTEQQVAFAIFCAALVWDESKCPAWQEWAVKWLAGEDRSAHAAHAAHAARAAAYTAYAANAAANAANAANAAHAAAYTANAANAAANAAHAAAYTANAAANAAYAAAYTANAANAAYAAAYTANAANAAHAANAANAANAAAAANAETLETAIAWALAL